MKKKYCKYCGGLLNEDRICSECGHKFFKIRIKKDKYLTIALAISTLVLLFISLDLYNNNNVIHNNNTIYKQQIADLNIEVSDLKERLDNANENYKYLKSQLNSVNEYKDKLSKDYDEIREEYLDAYSELHDYYNYFAAYAPNYGNCYHKLNCFYLNKSNVIYYDYIPDIERRGYRPCSYCY